MYGADVEVLAPAALRKRFAGAHNGHALRLVTPLA
jgi:hypothetical protein